jgi:excinuclease ABC subunit A
VATITEIYDYLRILYARVGKPHCLVCGREIRKHSNEEIIQSIARRGQKLVPKKTRKVMGVEINEDTVRIYAPVVVGRKGEYYQLLYDLLGKGLRKGKGRRQDTLSLREQIIGFRKIKSTTSTLWSTRYLSLSLPHSKQAAMERLSEAVERALDESEGLVKIEEHGERLVSAKFMCAYDGFSFPEVEPRLFSFNSPYGACPACNGLGTKHLFTTSRARCAMARVCAPRHLMCFWSMGERQNPPVANERRPKPPSRPRVLKTSI